MLSPSLAPKNLQSAIANIEVTSAVFFSRIEWHMCCPTISMALTMVSSQLSGQILHANALAKKAKTFTRF